MCVVDACVNIVDDNIGLDVKFDTCKILCRGCICRGMLCGISLFGEIVINGLTGDVCGIVGGVSCNFDDGYIGCGCGCGKGVDVLNFCLSFPSRKWCPCVRTCFRRELGSV